jgi:hypothetical protein
MAKWARRRSRRRLWALSWESWVYEVQHDGASGTVPPGGGTGHGHGLAGCESPGAVVLEAADAPPGAAEGEAGFAEGEPLTPEA